MIASLLASCYVANGQSLLERLGQRAKNAVENKLGEKVEQGVNDALDGRIGKKKKKDKADKQTAETVSMVLTDKTPLYDLLCNSNDDIDNELDESSGPTLF